MDPNDLPLSNEAVDVLHDIYDTMYVLAALLFGIMFVGICIAIILYTRASVRDADADFRDGEGKP